MPEGAMKSTSYPMNEQMSNLKNAVSSQCGQPINSIIFLYDGKYPSELNNQRHPSKTPSVHLGVCQLLF